MSSSAQSFNANSKTSGILIGNNFKLKGTLDINMEQDQVLWSYDNQLKIFSAAQIKEIIIEGMPAYLSESLHDEKYLFEVLAFGQVTILYREGVIKDEFTKKTYDPYFTRTDKGLKELSRKKDFLGLFGNDEKWMELHIQNDDLDLDNKEDVITAFRYYNQTFEATSPSP